MANKGYVMPLWSFNSAGAAQEALAQAKASGANSVNIDFSLLGGPNGYTASSVQYDPNASLSKLATVLDLAKGQGLDVWLKPVLHVGMDPSAPNAGNWTDLKPQDSHQWFQSYGSILKEVGSLAQAHGVSHYIITNELRSMTTNPAYAGEWDNLISEVRTTFKGAIGFNSGAFWGNGVSEYQSVPESVVAKLDFMGFSAYPRFSNQSSTETIGQVEAGWNSDIYGRNDIAQVNAWIAQHPNKPLYFTELGSPAATGGYQMYGNYGSGNTVNNDYQDQASYLQGSLQALAKQAPGVKGVFVYEWSLSPQGGNYAWDVDQSPIVTNALHQGWMMS